MIHDVQSPEQEVQKIQRASPKFVSDYNETFSLNYDFSIAQIKFTITLIASYKVEIIGRTYAL